LKPPDTPEVKVEVKGVNWDTMKLALTETLAITLYVVSQIGGFYLFSRIFYA
jgi:hypothetical protein